MHGKSFSSRAQIERASSHRLEIAEVAWVNRAQPMVVQRFQRRSPFIVFLLAMPLSLKA